MLIAIEGCVGAGKTTIARGLAARRGSVPLFENFESNPFLRAFYADPAGNATETEFAFLLVHYHQLKHLGDLAKNSEVVADFHLGKDLIYADLNLTDEDVKRLFLELYEFFLDKTRRPALLIFLSATTDLVIERIRWRDRDFEQTIEHGYYAALNHAYEEYFKQYSGRKLRLCMDEWDFVKDPALYDRLAALVDQELNSR